MRFLWLVTFDAQKSSDEQRLDSMKMLCPVLAKKLGPPLQEDH